MTERSTDLSGGWHGIFSYPNGRMPPTAFTVVLRDHAGILAGDTTEPGQTLGARGQTLHGLLVGRHIGDSVTFTKTYDNYHTAPIHYSGSVNGEATEISGSWDIPGVWSGTFIMVRPAGSAKEIDLRIGEAVT